MFFLFFIYYFFNINKACIVYIKENVTFNFSLSSIIFSFSFLNFYIFNIDLFIFLILLHIIIFNKFSLIMLDYLKLRSFLLDYSFYLSLFFLFFIIIYNFNFSILYAF